MGCHTLVGPLAYYNAWGNTTSSPTWMHHSMRMNHHKNGTLQDSQVIVGGGSLNKPASLCDMSMVRHGLRVIEGHNINFIEINH